MNIQSFVAMIQNSQGILFLKSRAPVNVIFLGTIILINVQSSPMAIARLIKHEMRCKIISSKTRIQVKEHLDISSQNCMCNVHRLLNELYGKSYYPNLINILHQSLTIYFFPFSSFTNEELISLEGKNCRYLKFLVIQRPACFIQALKLGGRKQQSRSTGRPEQLPSVGTDSEQTRPLKVDHARERKCICCTSCLNVCLLDTE